MGCKRDHVLTDTGTGTVRNPGPGEEGRQGREGERAQGPWRPGRGRAARPAPHWLSPAKACCSEARRPAPASPPLAYPGPCGSSPFAPAGAHHGKAPPPHTRTHRQTQTHTPEPAPPNCATACGAEAGRAEQLWRGGAATSGAASLRGL